MSVYVYSVSVLSCVQVAALRRAHPPSKESHRLCKKIKKLKKQPRSNKGLYSHGWTDERVDVWVGGWMDRRFIALFTKVRDWNLSLKKPDPVHSLKFTKDHSSCHLSNYTPVSFPRFQITFLYVLVFSCALYVQSGSFYFNWSL
jgi:hypothetical protein